MSRHIGELSERFHGQPLKFRIELIEEHRSTSWRHRDGHWFYCFEHNSWQGAMDEAQRMRQEGKLAAAVSPCGQAVHVLDGRAERWA